MFVLGFVSMLIGFSSVFRTIGMSSTDAGPFLFSFIESMTAAAVLWLLGSVALAIRDIARNSFTQK